MRLLTSAVFVLFSILPTAPIGAQGPVSQLKLRSDPENARVRPLESIVVQALVYNDVSNGADGTQSVRVQKNGISFELKGDNSGWISKPFRFQGQENESFYEPEERGLASLIFDRARSQYTLQDAVLYTAPERNGSYEIRASIDGKDATIRIEVDSNAASTKPMETTAFPPESGSNDPFRRLVENYAPFVAQETWFDPKADYLARFDLDGDWRGDNNWANAYEGTSQAYAHYAVIESGTHWFLIYNFFHPRDYSDKCVVGTCHENDNEGLILTVLKDGSTFGRLQTMETLAHNNVYSYRADSRVRSNLHNIDGDVEFFEGSHPVIFIESGGHGVYGSLDSHSTYSLRNDSFSGNTGVTYVYRGSAERPRFTNDRMIGYQLLSIYDYWWLRAQEGEGRGTAFDEYYVYEPFGRNRPRPRYREIAGSFLGRAQSANKAKPFWGWHDNRSRKKDAVATGQWGLDPAYSALQNLSFPAPFSVDYVFNPYLGIGQATVSSVTQPGPSSILSLPAKPILSAPSASLASIPARRASDYNTESNRGQFDVRVYVDHILTVYIQNSDVRYENEGVKAPKDDGSEYTQPIPRATFRTFALEQKDGRGKITLLERPTPENNFTAKLRFEDTKGGDDRYHARLTWEIAERYLEPSSPQQVILPVRDKSSSVISKHIGSLGTAPSENVPPPAAMPGREIFSSDNNSGRYDSRSEGFFEFRGRVDGTVLFYIRGDRVFAHNVSGRPVEVERFSFSQALPGQRLGDVRVEREDGRGDVELLEQPWDGNQFTAVVEVTDDKGGDDRYHFRVRWKR